MLNVFAVGKNNRKEKRVSNVTRTFLSTIAAYAHCTMIRRSKSKYSTVINVVYAESVDVKTSSTVKIVTAV